MPAHDIPATPEVRASMAQSEKEAMDAFGLTPGRVEAWEDGYRAAATEDSTFEWWYFDVHFDDGSTLVVTFSNKPHTDPGGPLKPTLLLIRQLPDGTSRQISQEFPAAEFSASTAGCDVRIGPNTVRGDLDVYTLHVQGEDIVADVRIDRAAPSWRPGAGVSYFDAQKEHYLAWVVPVPYGMAEATITEGGSTRALTGQAYHDHNWGNRLMGSFLDHWYWGRAHVGDYTVVYVRMTTRGLPGVGQINIPTFYLAKGDQLVTDDMLPLRLTTSGEVEGPGGHTYPTRMEWTWEGEQGRIAMSATDPVLITALDLPAAGRAASEEGNDGGKPMYYDFNAGFELDIDLDGLKDRATGHTLYEKMIFG